MLKNVKIDDVNRDTYYIHNLENYEIINYIDMYKYIIIIDVNRNAYAFEITERFRNAIKNLNKDFSITSVIEECFGIAKKLPFITKIKLGASIKNGGKKRVVKQTVKELQAIAVENNIKITKKVEGKTVRLNKKGLIAKLKRYKLI
jgi:hypothetical protein